MASMTIGDRCLSETLVRYRAEQGISNSHFRRPQLAGLTTLRFFAALHVILFHLKVEGILPGGPWWYQSFAGIGYIGVNFFFVLSGFILVYTYDAADIDPRLKSPLRRKKIVKLREPTPPLIVLGMREPHGC